MPFKCLIVIPWTIYMLYHYGMLNTSSHLIGGLAGRSREVYFILLAVRPSFKLEDEPDAPTREWVEWVRGPRPQVSPTWLYFQWLSAKACPVVPARWFQ